MRTLAGFLVFNALLAGMGLGLLAALRLVTLQVRELAWALGAALLLGAAVVGLAAVVALVAGAELTLPPVLLVCAVALAVLWGIAWRRRERGAEPAPEERADRTVTLVLGVAVGIFVLIQVVASRHVRAAWDAEHVWAVKAVALSTGGLDGELFKGAEAFRGAHLTYPILQPALGSLLFRLAGNARAGLITSELWLLTGALVFAGPWLLGLRHRRWMAMIPLALALVAAPTAGIVRGDADILCAVFAAFGALAMCRVVTVGGAGHAVVAALALGAAANVKDEGQAFAIAVIVAGLVALLAWDRRRLPVGIAVAAGTVCCGLPWYLWQRAHGPFLSDVTPASLWLDVGFLRDRLSQLDQGAQALLNAMSDAGYLWIVPAFIAVALSAVIERRARRVAVFFAVAVVLSVLFVLWAYWTYAGADPAGHILRTSIRTLSAPLFLAAAGLAYLLPLTVEARTAGGVLGAVAVGEARGAQPVGEAERYAQEREQAQHR